jgi:hypothetical protein
MSNQSDSDKHAQAACNPNPNMQKASFLDPNCMQERYGGIAKKVINLDGVVGTLVTFHAGSSVKAAGEAGAMDGLTSCPMPHIGYIISGSLGVRQDDGSEEQFDPGDMMMLPPGHDAWAVGDEDCVFIEFTRGSADYYGVDIH